MSAAASAQSSTFWDEHNASNSIVVYPTPTVIPAEIPTFTSLSGTVLDAHGNKVPGAYIILYRDGGTAPISGNPTYTGTEPGSGYGEYNFSGLRPGKYMVYAEKSDIFLYNGTASIELTPGLDTWLDVTIKGYTAKPTVKPESIHTMAVMAAPMVTALPSISPTTNSAEDIYASAKGKLPVLVPGLFIIAIGGAGYVTLRDPLKRKSKGNVVRQKPAAVAKKAEVAANTKVMPGPALKADDGYAAEIRELAEKAASSGYGDIATLNQINAVSKKYGIDQNRIFTDIKKAKGGKR